MSLRKEIQKKIEKKEAEIQDLRLKISAAESFIEGLREASRLAPPDESSRPVILRAGSDMERVRNILLAASKPLHIDQIVAELGGEASGVKRAGLAGSLSSYAKSNKVFTKVGPNTFGLIEYGSAEVEQAQIGEILGFLNGPNGLGKTTAEVAEKLGVNEVEAFSLIKKCADKVIEGVDHRWRKLL